MAPLKKLLSTISLSVLLTGCALFPSTFDSAEHTRLVNVYVSSIDTSICGTDRASLVVQSMYQDARWVYHYSNTLPNNAPMSKISFELMTMTKELNERYSKPEPVSMFYCKNKFENINRGADTAIKVSARRPRS